MIKKLKDIPEIPILKFLKKKKGSWTMRWDDDFLEAFPSNLSNPDKMIRLKVGKLIKKGLVSGCSCGCRGDFEITQKGIEYLKKDV